MEPTGVYLAPLYEILVANGIKFYFVNARHAKSVPGRKSNICDALWLQQLHSYGLIRASLQLDQRIAELHTYFRQRDLLVRYRSFHQQHMQKALIQMNLQLHHIAKDITGLMGSCWRQPEVVWINLPAPENNIKPAILVMAA